MLLDVLYWLLGNIIRPVKGVRSRCETSKSKRCYGNSNVKARLYSLSFDIYNMYPISVTEQKPTDPKLKMLWKFEFIIF